LCRSIYLHHCIMFKVCFMIAVRWWVRGSPFDFCLQMAELSPRHGGCWFRRRPRRGGVPDSNGVCESEEAEGLAWVLGFSSRTRRGPIALLSERAKAAPRALGYVLSFMPLRCCLYCLRAQPYSQCQCFDSRQAGLCLLRGLCIKV